jgi:hypothetical protein
MNEVLGSTPVPKIKNEKKKKANLCPPPQTY